MKNTKIVALVAAVALLVLGAAFTSMAATYNWYQQDGEWRCADKNGDDYYGAWAKSGADWYWLDDEGWMAKEALVDDDSKYVDAEGKMVKNDWKKVVDDENNEHWMYFQAGGKKMAAKDGAAPKPVTVTGKKYIFNYDGYMMSGWVNAVDFDQPEDDDDALWRAGAYYCGDAEDGAVTYGWRQIEVVDNSDDVDYVDQNYWFFFLPSGKRFAAEDDGSDNALLAQKVINGKKYAFDKWGVMKYEWNQTESSASADSASAAAYAWFHTAEDGSKLANGWFRVVPAKAFDATTNEDDTSKWFYAKSGKLATDTIKTIAGKKYAFNHEGEMLTGLQLVNVTKVADVDVYSFAAIDNDTVQLSDIDDDLYGDFVAYFSDDEDNDGSMKTGLQKVTVDGDEYDFYFSTKNGSKGQGLTGKQGNKYYFNGKKVASDDAVADFQFYALNEIEDTDKYYVSPSEAATFKKLYDATEKIEIKDVKYARIPAAGVALISKTGAVASSGTKKDGNGYKASYKKDGTVAYWYISLE